LVEGLVTYGFTLHLRIRDQHYMILKVCWDGLWTLSCGLSQFHGHGSRLVCEVALIGITSVVALVRCYDTKLLVIKAVANSVGVRNLRMQ
jgi:hypothetical protein